MTNKQKWILFILWPILFGIGIGLLNRFFENNGGNITFIEFIIEDLHYIFLFICKVIIVLSLMVWIILIFKKVNDNKILGVNYRWWFFRNTIIMVIGIVVLLVGIDIRKNCNIRQNISCDAEMCSSDKYIICESLFSHYMGWGEIEWFLPIKIEKSGEIITDGNINISEWETVGIGPNYDNFTINWWDEQIKSDWRPFKYATKHTYLSPWKYTIIVNRNQAFMDGANLTLYAKVIVSEVKNR